LESKPTFPTGKKRSRWIDRRGHRREESALSWRSRHLFGTFSDSVFGSGTGLTLSASNALPDLGGETLTFGSDLVPELRSPIDLSLAFTDVVLARWPGSLFEHWKSSLGPVRLSGRGDTFVVFSHNRSWLSGTANPAVSLSWRSTRPGSLMTRPGRKTEMVRVFLKVPGSFSSWDTPR